jgi:hypothetical protein
MLLRTAGKPNKVPMKLCKDAAKWFARRLLGERLYHNVEVKLVFNSKELGSNIYGYCDWNDDNHKARDFTITIDPNLGKRNMLLVIAHEMVHVKQYAKGELKDFVRVSKVKWQGKVYDDNEIDYWEQPWEIEAHGREKGLYYKFLNSLKAKKVN